jgi:UDP-glucose 4-epimerase
MRVLVTGGAGYIGSVIAARLVADAHQVVVYDDLFRGHRQAVPPQAEFVQGDVRDDRALLTALREGECEAVVHMAALAEVGESVAFPDRYMDVNTEGTRTLVRAALEAGVRRIVFSSTAAVYGSPERVPISEGARLAPTNPYGESKLAAERILQAAADEQGLAYAALRYFNAAGADGPRGEDHDPETHLLPLALRAARDGGRLAVFGGDYPTPDGTCLRDYVHVADLAEAHVRALAHLPAVTGAFNLGTGSGDSVLEVIAAVETVTGLALAYDVQARRVGDPPVLVAAHERATGSLGWRPVRSLRDAVADAWAWLQAHPEGYEE